eukprot:TRINITY_DN6412_c1_g1_i1.p1 TRINITY_DN6412_c1_g1~~TRINITY_DN6412_c1_g1_i1.p1  ORF type:complete len:384 (+),score=76.19 TRINITY_DN6412_c1_g1_i1:20-1171(+)
MLGFSFPHIQPGDGIAGSLLHNTLLTQQQQQQHQQQHTQQQQQLYHYSLHTTQQQLPDDYDDAQHHTHFYNSIRDSTVGPLESLTVPAHFPWTEEQIDTILWTVKMMNWASIAGATLVVLTFALFRWRFPCSFALYFSFSGLSLSWVLQVSAEFIGTLTIFTHPTLCRTQGVLLQFFATSLLWWWVCMVFNLYLSIVREYEKPERLSLMFVCIGWGVPTVFTVVPLWFQRYGHITTEPWCWIMGGNDHIWQYLFFYGPMGVASIVGLLMWAHIMIKAFLLHKARRVSFMKGYILRQCAFVLLELGVFVLLVANRVQLTVQSNDPNFNLVLAAAIVTSGQGLISFVCFGISKKNVDLWWGFIVSVYQRIVLAFFTADDNDPVTV